MRLLFIPKRQFCFLPIVATALFSAFCLAGNTVAAVSEGADQANLDGPAELPRLHIASSLADTPATGQTHTISQGDDLQGAIDGARCGETLRLQPGATFRGQFRFPAKNCDDSHWIVVRSGAPDDSLPPEGTRLTPCFAGIASLPGRPDLRCKQVRNVMARIEFDGKAGSGPIAFLPGANHYRFIGIEVTRGNPGASITALSFTKEPGPVNHLVFDRVWMHGTAQDETTRGLALRGMTYVAVVDSFFSDFHCVAGTGACTDAQTIVGGGGDDPEGPFKIENNFLEASGENLLFGGGAATQTPVDLEIRRNYLFKPMIWKPEEPGFVGGTSGKPFIVKNHFELKNAQRVLFEGNVLENTWGGFSQAGFSILLTPKNQQNRCPACRVNDVTIRYNKVRNVAGVLQLANVKSDAGGASSGGERYSIHDLVATDVHEKDFLGFGVFALVLSNNPPLRDVKIEHVTAFVPRAIFSFMNASGQGLANFTVVNNIFYTSGPREIGSAGGGPENCAHQPDRLGPAGVLKNCLGEGTVTHNLIIGGSNWPAKNLTVKDISSAGLRQSDHLVDLRPCKTKDENCKKASPAIGAGTDGKDIGADIDEIDKATEGVT